MTLRIIILFLNQNVRATACDFQQCGILTSAGWFEPLLVAHTTLLEISCTGSYVLDPQKNHLNEKSFIFGGQNISNLISSTVVNAFSKNICYILAILVVNYVCQQVRSLATGLDSTEPAPHCSLIRAFTASSHKVPFIHIPPIFCPEINWFSVQSMVALHY